MRHFNFWASFQYCNKFIYMTFSFAAFSVFPALNPTIYKQDGIHHRCFLNPCIDCHNNNNISIKWLWRLLLFKKTETASSRIFKIFFSFLIIFLNYKSVSASCIIPRYSWYFKYISYSCWKFIFLFSSPCSFIPAGFFSAFILSSLLCIPAFISVHLLPPGLYFRFSYIAQHFLWSPIESFSFTNTKSFFFFYKVKKLVRKYIHLFIYS